MSLRTRALILGTFFTSCASIGLLLLSLTTNYWIMANLKRDNVPNSKGNLNYGLFYGNKDLTTGFGGRNHQIDVIAFVQNEPEVMNFWLWLITVLATGFGLLTSFLSAILAVWRAAASIETSHSVFWLLFTNSIALITQMIASVTWMIHYVQYLRHNILSMEDRRLNWRSQGTVSLGYSFYSVMVATLVVLSSILILLRVRHLEQERRRRHRTDCDDAHFPEHKNHGAIMLY